LPLAESGYQPLPENSVRSAGILGFIPSTAQHYGLVVNAQQDDRFDSAKATQAALAYLSKLHNEFHDWNLAIMAYNQGEREIHRLMMQTGQSNAWQLIRTSYGNTELKKYLPAVHAAIIIMNHPELI
jgi:membrane-bound lytic murein transglycosylase D